MSFRVRVEGPALFRTDARILRHHVRSRRYSRSVTALQEQDWLRNSRVNRRGDASSSHRHSRPLASRSRSASTTTSLRKRFADETCAAARRPRPADSRKVPGNGDSSPPAPRTCCIALKLPRPVPGAFPSVSKACTKRLLTLVEVSGKGHALADPACAREFEKPLSLCTGVESEIKIHQKVA